MTRVMKLFSKALGIFLFSYGAVVPSVSSAEFSCASEREDLFETGLGFPMRVPEGFSQSEIDGYPKLVSQATHVDALGAAVEYSETKIWVEQVSRADIDDLDELVVRHSLGPDYEFRVAEYGATSSDKLYLLALVVGDKALMVLSGRPIEVQELLSCFVLD